MSEDLDGDVVYDSDKDALLSSESSLDEGLPLAEY